MPRTQARNTRHQFGRTPGPSIPRSVLDLSHTIKTTMDVDKLYPLPPIEVLPGDTFTESAVNFGRIATPLKVPMDDLILESFTFFVPHRIVWDNFVKMMGERDNPDDPIDFTVPQMAQPATTGYSGNTIYDYMGIPTACADLLHSSIPLRGYNLIYNYYFRDQDLIDSIPVNKGDSNDSVDDYQLRNRGKRFDYFTQARPAPQKGAPVTLPLGSSAPVVPSTTDPVPTFTLDGGTTVAGLSANDDSASGAKVNTVWETQMGAVGPAAFSYAGLETDLSSATAATINSIRIASQLQRLQEREMRSGSRYREIVKGFFGVETGDGRLQWPEILAHSRQFITHNPVAQTTQALGNNDPDTPQGNLAGYTTTHNQSRSWTRSFVEHGYVITLINLRQKQTYQFGQDRHWSRQTREDFYWNDLSLIGEQSILNKEIYAQGSFAPGVDEETFGYVPRYDEYRYVASKVTGRFRSIAQQSLDPWHYAQDWANLPVLNQTFIEEAVPIQRTIAVPSEPHLLLDVFRKIRAVRPMPVNGIPGIARF